MNKLRTESITLALAKEFVSQHHRHNAAPVGHQFSLGCYRGELLVGVAICGNCRARLIDQTGRVKDTLISNAHGFADYFGGYELENIEEVVQSQSKEALWSTFKGFLNDSNQFLKECIDRDYKSSVVEVNRLCINHELRPELTQNACSKLYAACVKEAKRRGKLKVITYTLSSESGTSLRASGWEIEAISPASKGWARKGRQRAALPTDNQDKLRWIKWTRPRRQNTGFYYMNNNH